MKRTLGIIAASLLVITMAPAFAQGGGAASMSELLRLIEQGEARENQEARQREAQFSSEISNSSC
ncbi:MAG: hypothetical protein O2907_04615 [Proteobacteria bacterium]|nr:hypothetical protein [Pseudomonadota bacterium]